MISIWGHGEYKERWDTAPTSWIVESQTYMLITNHFSNVTHTAAHHNKVRNCNSANCTVRSENTEIWFGSWEDTVEIHTKQEISDD